MTDSKPERRDMDNKMIFFMGEVTQHMKDDAIWKDNYIKTKVENRVTKIETKVAYISKAIYVMILFALGVSGRLVYKVFHS